MMANRKLLTQEIVNELSPPEHGELWVADKAVRGFGVRLWAGKKGGGSAYGIRVRDHAGKLVRETFSIWGDDPNSWFARMTVDDMIRNGQFEFPLGAFLEEARSWARDRLNVLGGRLTFSERRELRWRRTSDYVSGLTLEQMAERTLLKLEKSGRNREYLDNLIKLFGHISENIRSSKLGGINSKQLAMEITSGQISFGNSRVLQAFIGQILKRASRWCGPLGLKADEIQRNCYRLRRQRTALPYPEIKRITKNQMAAFFAQLEGEEKYWRAALAIRLYFATGAKLTRVLSAQWRHFVDDAWYPYDPEKRRYWFNGREPLDEDAKRILLLIKGKHNDENIKSKYLFPSNENPGNPISSVRRVWIRISKSFGWKTLPLSHVVLRHKDRNTPSYFYSHYTFFVPLYEANVLTNEFVSKVRKAHKNT